VRVRAQLETEERMSLHIGVLRETRPGEHRVALTPDVVARLVKAGHDVAVQAGAGIGAGWGDDAWQEAGASVGVDVPATLVGRSVLVKVHPPTPSELDVLDPGTAVIAMLDPLNDRPGIEQLAERGLTTFAMELIPRISRAQSMDVLSSMATVAGYRAVLLAAQRLDKFFPMLMTAAGTVAPAKVFVVGAGVAGLQAIATARRLGAVVSAYDTRAVVREQVESLGATFLDISVGADAEAAGGYARELTDAEQRRQRELMADHVAGCDVVVTTALVPGRPAPVIIPATTVERMRPGSVIVDLASQNGGNCEVSEHGRDVLHHGVHVLGPDNLAGGMPVHASQLYARNVQNLLELLVQDGELAIDSEDEVVVGTLATRGGQVVNPLLRDRWQLDAEVVS
jgi:NAD(P) transhydrogenase subunit alpha